MYVDVDLCRRNGKSPLKIVCQNGHAIIVNYLFKNRAYVNVCTLEGVSPLYVPSLNGHNSTVEL